MAKLELLVVGPGDNQWTPAIKNFFEKEGDHLVWSSPVSVQQGLAGFDFSKFDVCVFLISSKTSQLFTDSSLPSFRETLFELIRKIQNKIPVTILVEAGVAEGKVVLDYFKSTPKSDQMQVVFAEHFHPDGLEMTLHGLSNLFQSLKSHRKWRDMTLAHLQSFQEEMGEVEKRLEQNEKFMKRLHELLVPMRSLKGKGAKFFAKYASGTSQGGEFFDFFESSKDHKIVFFLSSTNSYLVSSHLMLHYGTFKENPDDPAAFVEKIKNDIEKEFSDDIRSGKINFYLHFGVLDIHSLKLLVYQLSSLDQKSSLLYWSDRGGHVAIPETFIKSLFNAIKYEMIVGRGDRLFLFSPGLQKNWIEKNQNLKFKEGIDQFLRGQMNESSADILNLLYMNLYQNHDEDELSYLQFDSTCIVFEIEENVMVKM